MTIIGVTGGFGTGKTTVAGQFKDKGAVVLDADEIAHKVTSRNGGAYKKVVKVFGKGILKRNKEIDRRRLGKLTFNNKGLLKKLCAIIHPPVIKTMRQELQKLKKENPASVVILDVPLLIEADMLKMVDKLIVVNTKRRLQIKRCREKTGLGREEILARIKSQMPIKEKIGFSDFLIDNNGTRKETERKVKKIWEQIQQQTIPRKRTLILQS